MGKCRNMGEKSERARKNGKGFKERGREKNRMETTK
jgi:hypothetical protein